MSDFTFLCPSCQQNIQASSDHSGMEVDCPLCHAKIVIPAAPEIPGTPRAPKSKLSISASAAEHKPQESALPPGPPKKKKKPIPPGLIIWPIVGVIAVVAGIKFGPSLYNKYKAKHDADVAAEEAAKNPPPPPPEPGAPEILAKMSDKYKKISSFSAQGKTTAALDMSQLAPNNPALQSVNLTADTGIRMARPDLYRLDWALQAGSGPAVKGAAWSTSKGNFVALGSPYPSKVKDREAALAQAAGASGTLGMLLVELFFNDKENASEMASGFSKTNSENLNGEDCFVLTGDQNAMKIELWVNKKNFLVSQAEVFLTGQLDDAAYKAQTNSAVKNEMMRASKIKGTITETYQNVEPDKSLAPADFEKPMTNAATP